MNSEIEQYIIKNISEMNISIKEIEISYYEDIKKFDDNEIFSNLILNLKEEMQEQIENVKQIYEKERKNQIRKIKNSYLKNV